MVLSLWKRVLSTSLFLSSASGQTGLGLQVLFSLRCVQLNHQKNLWSMGCPKRGCHLLSVLRIVHLCLRKADQKLVIIKQIPVEQMTKEERQAAQNECQVLKLLNHPNVIEYYENFLEDKALMIAMEYAPGRPDSLPRPRGAFPCQESWTPLGDFPLEQTWLKGRGTEFWPHLCAPYRLFALSGPSGLSPGS